MPNKVAPRPLAEFITDAVHLTEAKDGPPRLEGQLAKVDVINRNNRYYSREVFEKAIAKAQPMVEGGEFTGELDHPDFSVMGSLEKTAFVYERLALEDDLVVFEARLLNTPAGTTLKALLDGGVRVGMSTRGTASIEWKEPKKGEKGPPIAIIQEDFTLYGGDAVKVPSNEAGIARLRESVEARIDHLIPQEREEPTVSITTVEELREQLPELVREVEEAISGESEAAKAELVTATEEIERLKADLEQTNEALAEATKAQEQLDALRTQLLGEGEDEPAEEGEHDLSVAVAALRETVDELKRERDAAKDESERLTREQGLRTAFETAVEQSSFSAILRDEVDPTSFETEEALLAEVARLEKLAKRVSGSTGTPGKGKVGEDPADDLSDDNPLITERMKRLAGIGEG